MKIKLIKISLSLILIIISNFSFACDCNKILTFEEAVAVFTGKVIKIERVVQPYIYYNITFKVKWIYKGEELITEKTTVRTTCLSENCCGYGFKLGRKYKVYTFRNANSIFLIVNNCTGTFEFKRWCKPYPKGFLKKPRRN